MLRLTVAIALAVAGALAGGASAHGATLCVGGPGCYSALQPAFDAAHDGDRIRIDPGTYTGGVTVTKSVTVQGSGANQTIIQGGGPVLTIGTNNSPDNHDLTVSISGLTITGGVAQTVTTPDGPVDFIGQGGGISIPNSVDPFTVGATVTIRNTVVTGNRASPANVAPGAGPCTNDDNCPFAGANGGGIADVGRLTLINSVVSDNVAGGPVASDADGGGIWTATAGGPGALTLINTTVTRNSAIVTAPYGRGAQGGGVQVQDGEALVVQNSTISDNTASVSNTLPQSVDSFAGFGGLHTGGFGNAVIENTSITGNVASATDPNGAPGVADSALGIAISDFCACGETLELRNSLIAGNSTILRAGSSDNGPSGGVVEIDGQATVDNTEIRDNTISFRNDGSASALGTFFAFDNDAASVVVTNSAIRNNQVEARAATGPVTVWGGGVLNGGALELHGVDVSRNAVRAFGDTGVAQGGGIWNGRPFDPNDPAPQLTLQNTNVTRNTLLGMPGVTRRGGGLYTPGFQVSAINTLIERNQPDQCFGC